MGEIGQAKVGPDSFRYIDYGVAVRIPWGEDANFSFTLWHKRAIEEPYTRVASSGVWQNF